MQMFRALLILCLCSAFLQANAQTNSYEHLDSVVSEYISQLKAKNIDTIGIFQDYVVGAKFFRKGDDICDGEIIHMTTYIFWVKHGETFLTKKNNCFDFSTITIDIDSVWKYFFANIDTIKKEKIRSFRYSKASNIKGQKDTVFVTIDHSRQQKLNVMHAHDTTRVFIDNFNLEKSIARSKWVRKSKGYTERKYNVHNMSYEHNISLKGKKLVDMMVKVTDDIENKGLLTKTRRQ